MKLRPVDFVPVLIPLHESKCRLQKNVELIKNIAQVVA